LGGYVAFLDAIEFPSDRNDGTTGRDTNFTDERKLFSKPVGLASL
jgi:hypothetical protein